MKTKIKIILTFLFATILLLNYSCSHEITDNEFALITQYVKANGITITPNVNGVYIINDSTGKGNPCVSGDYVMYNYNAYKITGPGKVLYDTSDTTLATKNGLVPNIEFGGPVWEDVSSSILPLGLMDAFLSMNVGGASDFIIPSTVWDNSDIPRFLHINLVYANPAMINYQDTLIKNYLDTEKYNKLLANPILPNDSVSYKNNTDITVTGVYYIPITQGNGTHIAYSQTANISYTMKLINGSTILSDTSYQEVYGSTSNAIASNSEGYIYMPTGFDAGVSQMTVGGSGIIVVPYSYGFNSVVYNNENQVVIQPYATLVIYVKLKSIFASK